jgi:hypothetical protein
MQVNDFVKRWRVPVGALLLDTEALVVEACHGIIAHRVKGSGSLAARFKSEVFSLTRVTGPRRSLRLELSDTRVELKIRASLGTTAQLCKVVFHKLRARLRCALSTPLHVFLA